MKRKRQVIAAALLALFAVSALGFAAAPQLEVFPSGPLPACDPPATQIAHQYYQTDARKMEGSATFHIAPSNAPCWETLWTVATNNRGVRSAPASVRLLIVKAP